MLVCQCLVELAEELKAEDPAQTLEMPDEAPIIETGSGNHLSSYHTQHTPVNAERPSHEHGGK